MVVTFALIFYSVAVIAEQKKSALTKLNLVFLTAGVLFDISSTMLMIFGSTNIPLTVHGVIGYSALLIMLFDAILIWKHWISNRDKAVPRKIHLYTRIAYCWWVIVYIVGAAMSVASI